MKSNILLIGMPGAGKSTVGVLLAKQLLMEFVDTDVLIQLAERRSLQDIVDADGYQILRDIEQRVLLQIDARKTVVATGGSAVYSSEAMNYLRLDGVVVFLNADLVILRSRIHNYESRGLAKRPDQTFAELFEERQTLYRRYADVTIDCGHLTQDETCARIVQALR